MKRVARYDDKKGSTVTKLGLLRAALASLKTARLRSVPLLTAGRANVTDT
jgi:hypothetical protein